MALNRAPGPLVIADAIACPPVRLTAASFLPPSARVLVHRLPWLRWPSRRPGLICWQYGHQRAECRWRAE